MQRVLVTGGAGFIGSHTVDLLLSKGLKVSVIDNLETGKLTNLDILNPDLEFFQADIRDKKIMKQQVARADAVLHLAALPFVQQSIDEPLVSLGVNLEGFVHVLEAVRHNHKKIKVVYASSAAVYGESKELPCSDTAVALDEPLSPYALEKFSNEKYAALFARLFEMKCMGLRYFNVYGARQDPKSPYSGVISKFMDQYKAKEPLTVFGDGKQTRDFIHVSDVARANFQALTCDYSGVVNIATSTKETLLNMISYIEAAGGYKAEVKFDKARLGDIYESYADVASAKKHMDFSSKVALKDGLALFF